MSGVPSDLSCDVASERPSEITAATSNINKVGSFAAIQTNWMNFLGGFLSISFDPNTFFLFSISDNEPESPEEERQRNLIRNLE